MKRKTVVSIVVMVALVVILGIAFSNPGSSNSSDQPDKAKTTQSEVQQKQEATSVAAIQTTQNQMTITTGSVEKTDNTTKGEEKTKPLDKYLTEPTPDGKPTPVEPQQVQVDKKKIYSCTLSVSCGTILNNMKDLDPDKVELVPDDGIIFPATKVDFYEGESVFDVLSRVLKDEKIHFEYVNTPVYNSAYIEGIHNLYEFDCGELSGWMYKVNDWFPNYGCSRYQLKDGDVVEWLYTCDLGRDIGGDYAAGGE